MRGTIFAALIVSGGAYRFPIWKEFEEFAARFSRGTAEAQGKEAPVQRPEEGPSQVQQPVEGPLPGRFLYVGILSAPKNVERRARVRSSFLTSLRKANPDHKVRAEFIIGHGRFQGAGQGTKAEGDLLKEEEALREEEDRFGDIRRIPLPEAYENLPDKTLQLLQAGVDGRYGFIVKIDDDMALDVPRVQEYFRSQDPSSLLYTGEYLWDKPVYKPSQLGERGDFREYFGGPLYAVSYELARRITHDHVDHTGEFMLYGSSSEDVDMGYWADYEGEHDGTSRRKGDSSLRVKTVKMGHGIDQQASFLQGAGRASGFLHRVARARARGRGRKDAGAERECLSKREQRPSRVQGPGGLTVEIPSLDEVKATLYNGATKNPGLLNLDAPPPKKRSCISEIPKLLHFIWVGSPLRDTHAENILGIARANPEWSIYLWVDHKVGEAESKNLAELASRPGGAVTVKWVPDEAASFRNRDLIDREQNLAGKADYMRLEVVYQYGGIYLDTDARAVHGFDEFGRLFRWPFVSQELTGYKNLGNCVFGAEKKSAFLDFALDATRENCITYNTCGVMSGAGPGFLTGAYLKYSDPDIVLVNQVHLVQPVGPQNIMYQTMEANWLKPGGEVKPKQEVKPEVSK